MYHTDTLVIGEIDGVYGNYVIFSPFCDKSLTFLKQSVHLKKKAGKRKHKSIETTMFLLALKF